MPDRATGAAYEVESPRPRAAKTDGTVDESTVDTTSQETLAALRATASLADGQRSRDRRYSATGRLSDTVATESGRNAGDNTMSEKGFGEDVVVAVTLGVASWLDDCVAVTDDDVVPVRLVVDV